MSDGSLPKRAEQIFSEALDVPPADRLEYVRRKCAGDETLFEEVRSLLSSLENAATFLEPPTDAPKPLGFRAGDRIGRYTLLERLGEGGMGVVFLAHQHEPVRRKVALKVIKPGMDSAAVVARFEAERQALALMDHSHIARVLDAGSTDAGLPYFVMELVRGVPITKFAEKNNLNLKDRLRLFIEVCEAVQHAHQKGVIHRDLKPSNILVETIEGKPTPKIIDFGIAKALGATLSDRTLFTRHGQLIGTLEYMAPEQASAGVDESDIRADIYSLGVLLYELLTRSLPFESETLQKIGVAEFRRLIEQVDPPKPSTRLSTGHTTTVDAPSTRPRTRTWAREVRGDLDWITMRALEKDRNRRYPSASELAMDIRRHLNNEPVSAGPPSVGYRLAKFYRRNRVGVGAAGLVAASLVVGLGLAIWQAQVATAANRQKQLALDEERAMRQKLDTYAASSMMLLAGVFDEVWKEVTPLNGSAQAEKAITDVAIAFTSAVEPISAGDTALLRAVAEAREKTGMVLEGSGGAGLGRTADAIAQFLKSREIRLALFNDAPDDVLRGQLWVTNVHLGRVYRRSCQELASIDALRAALDYVVSLDPDRAGDRNELLRRATVLGELGETEIQLGRFKEAESNLREALALTKQASGDSSSPATLRRVSVRLVALADGLIDMGAAPQAIEHARDAVDMRKRLLVGNEERGREPRDLYVARTTLARAYLESGQFEAALAEIAAVEEFVRLERDRRPADDFDQRSSYDLASALLIHGRALRLLGRADESKSPLRESESIALALSNRDSGSCRPQQLLSQVRAELTALSQSASTSSP